MDKIKLIIKGFILGIANIIPGVSGGTLMISLGIFEEIIEAISHFFKNFKQNLKFLIPIGIGALLSVVLMSRVVTYTLENFKLPTILFFIGLIIGGIPMLYKTIKNEKITPANIIIFIIMFGIVAFMTFFDGGLGAVDFANMTISSYLLLFLVGVIAAASMVVPGLSGSFILILLGYYEPILEKIKEFTSLIDLTNNFIILSIFGIGIIVGIVLVAKLIEFLLEKFKIKTYYGILGFVFASIMSIVVTSVNDGLTFSVGQIIFAIVLANIGFFISMKLGD